VEDVPLRRDIVAGFSFPASPVDLSGTQVVTFSVRNDSREAIQFPRPGGEAQGIERFCFRVTKRIGYYRSPVDPGHGKIRAECPRAAAVLRSPDQFSMEGP
jgi:hypothetical protein